MTRRDIIIIAVLANIGILAVIFMLAVRPEDDNRQNGHEIAYALEEVEIPMPQGLLADVSDREESDEDALIDEVGTIVTAPGAEDEEEFTLTAEEAPVAIQQPDPAPAAHQGPSVQVTVKKGDVLEKIARANGTTVQAIMKANNLKSDKLKIGQLLHVPVGAKPAHHAPAPAHAPQPQSLQPGEPQYYVVKPGDNPWKIAKVAHIKVDDLLRLNNLDEEKARNLKVGDRLRIR